MIIKPGCRMEGASPELSIGLVIARDAYAHFGIDLVVTEITGAKHMEGSLHYKGRAADLRLPSRSSSKLDIDKVVTEYLRSCLGLEWDVVLEKNPNNPANDHIHIEFDPKQKVV